RRPPRRLSKPAEGERRTRFSMVRIVDEELRLVRHVDDLDTSIRALPPPPFAVFTESNRLPVLEVDAVLLLLADEVERAVVVDVAVLEDLHECTALMRGRGTQHIRQV